MTLLKAGDRVGVSEATLLSKLNIKPFLYGLIPRIVYDHGLVYDTKVLDMSDEDVFSRLRRGIQVVAALGLQTGIPNVASVPHSIARGFKNLLGIAVATEYSFPKADKIKEIISNPEAAKAAAAAAAAAVAPKEDVKKEPEEKGGKGKGGKPKEAEKPKEEKPEEEEADMGLDLFA